LSAIEPLPDLSSPASSAEEVGRRALRKAWWRLIPLLGLGYGLAYVDRTNVSFAALQMNRQLHFSASIYGLGAGLFFVGYALFEVPSNLLLLRFGARRWLARVLLTWGALAAGMLLVKTPREFYTMRFLLGVAEAGFFPGVVYYVTLWFPAEQRARAVSRFYVAVPVGGVAMGAIAGAILGLDGRMGLAGWQWLFLLEGLPALALGLVYLRWLPDGPADAPWLTGEERLWLRTRLDSERRVSEPGNGGGWRALIRELLSEPRFWQMALYFLCMLIVIYSFTFSAPAMLVKMTGWTAGQVGYLTAGFSLLGAVAMIVNAQHSDQTGERYLHSGIPFLIMAVGFVVGGLGTTPWAIAAFAVSTAAYYSTMGPQWAIPPTFLEGPRAAPAIAAMNTIGILGGFIGPYWMGVMRDWTGSYALGTASLSVVCLAGAGLMLQMRAAERRRSQPR
jgi:ACS family tartrate transporter-like MFS transporter